MIRWSTVSRKLKAPWTWLRVGTSTSTSVGDADYSRLSSQRVGSTASHDEEDYLILPSQCVGGTASHDEEDQSIPSSQCMGGTASHIEADHLTLSSQYVQQIAGQVKIRKMSMLSAKQCQDLSSKLSKAIGNIQELVSPYEASAVVAFQPALEEFQRIVEEAWMLVEDCSRAEWLKASMFQIRNEEAFREILLKVGLCYNVIYDKAKTMSLTSGRVLKVKGLRSLPLDSTFRLALEEDVLEDEQTLRRRLEDVIQSQEEEANDLILARYLLLRLTAPAISEEWSLEVSRIMYDASTLQVSDSDLEATWDVSNKPLSKGSGADGVFKTMWLGMNCAKKIFFQCGTDMNPVFEKEAPLLASINHPNIVKFFCCGSSSEGHEEQCFIGMELMERSLSNLIVKRRKEGRSFPIHVALDIILQIARGMLYMHELGTAHRDLKPHNVGVSKAPNGTFCVKLLDFGLSKTKVQVSKSNTVTRTSRGTLSYRAPEVFAAAKATSSKQKVKWFRADVYSFAVTCCQILTLQEPYALVELNALYSKLKDGLRPTLPADCPETLSTLVKECWEGDFNLRPNFWSICERLEKFKHDLLLQGPGAASTEGVDQLRGENVASLSSYAFIETMLKRRSELRTPAKHLAKVVENEGATSECEEGHISEGDESDDAEISKGDEGAISEGGNGAITKGVDGMEYASELGDADQAKKADKVLTKVRKDAVQMKGACEESSDESSSEAHEATKEEVKKACDEILSEVIDDCRELKKEVLNDCREMKKEVEELLDEVVSEVFEKADDIKIDVKTASEEALDEFLSEFLGDAEEATKETVKKAAKDKMKRFFNRLME